MGDRQQLYAAGIESLGYFHRLIKRATTSALCSFKLFPNAHRSLADGFEFVLVNDPSVQSSTWRAASATFAIQLKNTIPQTSCQRLSGFNITVEESDTGIIPAQRGHGRRAKSTPGAAPDVRGAHFSSVSKQIGGRRQRASTRNRPRPRHTRRSIRTRRSIPSNSESPVHKWQIRRFFRTGQRSN
jgi:hypothetical protein